MRASFGFGGQKCSANSRVYVARSAHDELVRRREDQAHHLELGMALHAL